MEATGTASADQLAWLNSRTGPERRQLLVTNGLICGLHPLWILFDFYLAPDHWRTFAWLRAVDVALGLLLWAVLPKGRSPISLKWLLAVRVTLTGWILAYMTASMDASFYAYVFGFSLLFWGAGILWVMPARSVLVVYGGIVVVFAAAILMVGDVDALGPHYLGGTFYLASTAVIVAAGAHVRFNAERQRFFSSRELARSNQEKTEALRALEDAQIRMVESEKLMALGRLLAGLSHEINNPLTVIVNNVDPLIEYQSEMSSFIKQARSMAQSSSDQAAAELLTAYDDLELDFIDEDSRKALQSVAYAADRIRCIHADLRKFIRGESPERGWIDVNDGIRVTLRMLERGLPPGVEIRSRLEELPPARANGGRLNQVVLNLLRNALDAVGTRGVVTIESCVQSDRIEIVITDDGPGVAPELVHRIFEPFFTTKEPGKGTGLGLSTCYEIIDQHGGSLSLDESHSPGARFVVSLPVSAAPDNEAALPGAPARQAV